MKITLFLLIAAGMVLSGCSGSPATVDRFGHIQPDLQNSPTGVPTPGTQALEGDSKAYLPAYNPDGTVTVFSNKNFQIRILPMTDGRTRGAMNRTTSEFDAMIAKYEGELRTNPNDYDACIMLAGLYIDRGRPGDADKAIDYSNRALALNQNDPQALYARGVAFSEKGDSAKAISDLTAVLRANIQSMKGVYYIMGVIHYKEGKLDEAREAFEAVRAIDPEFIDINEVLEELSKLKA
jgi:hypothetical protein